MQTKALLLTAFAAFSSVASAGYAKVANNCPFTVYLWSATPAGTSQQQTLPAGSGFYQEAYQNLPNGGGVALKLSRNPGDQNLYNGSPLTQDQYTLSGETVWYNLADTAGSPFAGYRVQLVPTTGQSIVWPNGSGPSQILNTASSSNLTLTLCA